jgi:hypothetical protein
MSVQTGQGFQVLMFRYQSKAATGQVLLTGKSRHRQNQASAEFDSTNLLEQGLGDRFFGLFSHYRW